jgi:ABC-type Fe3+ transport system permease subunit
VSQPTVGTARTARKERVSSRALQIAAALVLALLGLLVLVVVGLDVGPRRRRPSSRCC